MAERTLTRALIGVIMLALLVPVVSARDVYETFVGGRICSNDGENVIWTDDPDHPWSVGTSGLIFGTGNNKYWESAQIGPNEESVFTLDVNIEPGGGIIEFQWAVESEWGFDFFVVYLNGGPELVGTGDQGGQALIELDEGANKIEFVYFKDGLIDEGADAVGIDTVHITHVVGEPGFTIGGRVYADLSDPLNSGLEGVIVSVDGYCGTYASAPSEADGTWLVDGVNGGTYTLTTGLTGCAFQQVVDGVPGSAPPITLEVDIDHLDENLNLEFLGDCEYNIGGKVKDAGGSGVTGVTITVDGDQGTFNAITSGSQGAWTINDVPYGTYTVTPTMGDCCVFAPETVDIQVSAANETANKNIQIVADCEYLVAGQVYSDLGDPTGSGLAGVTVTLDGTPGTFVTQTLTGGVWILDGVPCGSYTLTPSVSGCAFVQVVDGVPGDPAPITIAADLTHELEIQDIEFLATCEYSVGGSAYGNLDDPANSGLTNVTVTVEGDNGTFITQTSGANGAWQVDNVPLGTYDVTLAHDECTFQQVVDGVPGSAPPITITVDYTNEAENLDLQFLAACNTYIVAGVIYTDLGDPPGSGLLGVTVAVDGTGGLFEAQTNMQGQWQIDAVPYGTYDVTPARGGCTFQHVVDGVPGAEPPITIIVDMAHETEIQALEFLAECSEYELGDLNCDGAVNGFDIDAFVLALQGPDFYDPVYPDCDINLADINQDGSVNGFDIDPFIDLLIGGG
ncbi:MAG: carboxypeptidase regulatory-like domain-containing protein [Planctomycetes bacterium]|nr:carboxypeptidase regulatory-like domain-containing protein [Planctomycetota bacterium]